MVKSIKNKSKINKVNNKTKKSKHSSSRKNKQRGGVSNACVLSYTNDNISYKGSGSSADIHNTNPQASLDLDNKFMSYGGPVPLGQMGGSNKCGDDGVGTSNPKSNTFKEYLNNLDNQLSFNGGSNCGIKNMSNTNTNTNTQKGSGYTFDPASNIAGNPQVIGYPDNNPPALINNKLILGGVDGSVCGNGATRGGGKKSKKSKHAKKSKSKKSKKSRHAKKSNLQKGGDFVSIGSKPAEFSTAFDGPKGVFKYPDDMMAREFGESQPNYSVNAI
jgi:hypothetical protein